MTGSDVEREREMMRRIRAVVECRGVRFSEVLRAAAIDPKTGLRFKNLSGVSFANEDLRGFDFTGSNVAGCDFTGSLIEGARFDKARLGQIQWSKEGGKWVVVGRRAEPSLEAAQDWEAYRRGWEKIDTDISDSSLCVGAIYQDAPRVPQMIVLPLISRDASCAGAQVSMSRSYFVDVRGAGTLATGGRAVISPLIGREQADTLCAGMSRVTGRRYCLPTREEFLAAREVTGAVNAPSDEIKIWCRDDKEPLCISREAEMRKRKGAALFFTTHIKR